MRIVAVLLLLLSACSAMPPLFVTEIPQQAVTKTVQFTPATTANATAVVDVDKLTLRTLPSESAPVVLDEYGYEVYLERGEEVNIQRCENHDGNWWAQVVTRKGAGWIAAFFENQPYIYSLEACK